MPKPVETYGCARTGAGMTSRIGRIFLKTVRLPFIQLCGADSRARIDQGRGADGRRPCLDDLRG